ncbi:AN1-type zinc finger protein 1 [Strongyloides ratti]|uniref:AN1-type zinc finger protein 1 n=1 Tax=Strongyloides ratti TaxID=34506 RepID=A0A090KX75_STRRB|nr:AN1-type zinc finger protein 1 [Strongyloides ratti]CEF62100.1 AN1-type zinc finger protein 1 [Strongyloides ratti]
MAEFPDLGKHCTLNSCNQLDFTPFLCDNCKNYYCGKHRHTHGCDIEDKQISNEDAKKNPMKIFLCSAENCNNKEVLRIECTYCQLNFCLNHKNPEGHQCKCLPVTKEKETLLPQAVIDKINQDVKEKKLLSDIKPINKKIKILTEKERMKMEKMETMRLKMRDSKLNIPEEEKYVIFLTTHDQKIRGALVSKCWMFGRCIDEFIKQNPDIKIDIKSVKFFNETGQELSFSDSLKTIFPNSVGRLTYQ